MFTHFTISSMVMPLLKLRRIFSLNDSKPIDENIILMSFLCASERISFRTFSWRLMSSTLQTRLIWVSLIPSFSTPLSNLGRYIIGYSSISSKGIFLSSYSGSALICLRTASSLTYPWYPLSLETSQKVHPNVSISEVKPLSSINSGLSNFTIHFFRAWGHPMPRRTCATFIVSLSSLFEKTLRFFQSISRKISFRHGKLIVPL